MATRRNNVSFRRVAWQDSGMDADAGFLGQLGPSLAKVLPMLDERSRRPVLGVAAEAEGEGGAGRGGRAPGRGGPAPGRGPQDAGGDRSRAGHGAGGADQGRVPGGPGV